MPIMIATQTYEMKDLHIKSINGGICCVLQHVNGGLHERILIYTLSSAITVLEGHCVAPATWH